MVDVIDASSFEILSETSDMIAHLEFVGRTAYKSYHNIKIGSSDDFIRRVIARGHESVLEHGYITVKFVMDRGMTHELVRHRLCAFTQESTRFCRYDSDTGIKVIMTDDEKIISSPEMLRCWMDVNNTCEKAYLDLIDAGVSPQSARDVLPHCLASEIVVTANIREWRHIFTIRTASDVLPKLRHIMSDLLDVLCVRYAVLFDDINKKRLDV